MRAQPLENTVPGIKTGTSRRGRAESQVQGTCPSLSVLSLTTWSCDPAKEYIGFTGVPEELETLVSAGETVTWAEGQRVRTTGRPLEGNLLNEDDFELRGN